MDRLQLYTQVMQTTDSLVQCHYTRQTCKLPNAQCTLLITQLAIISCHSQQRLYLCLTKLVDSLSFASLATQHSDAPAAFSL